MAAARELAEQQGWDAVTTRRLAERIEYSQPVLYSHFRGKREIIGAVALQGAAELATAVRTAASTAAGPRERVTALARTYLDYAARNPAVYDALFQLDGGLAYAQEDTPQPLKDAFAALLETLGEVAGNGVHPGLFTEPAHRSFTLGTGQLPQRREADRRCGHVYQRAARRGCLSPAHGRTKPASANFRAPAVPPVPCDSEV